MARRAKPEESQEVAVGLVADQADTPKADSSPPQESAEAPPKLSADARARLHEIRGRIETAVGQLVLLMIQSPKYRHHSLADLNNLIVEPLLRDRVSIVYARRESNSDDQQTPIGAAIWATVDEAADAKIKEQINSGVFPVRLSPGELTSGEILWLLDIVAPERRAATAVLMKFSEIAGDRSARLHPVAAKSVDAEVLKRLKEGRGK